LCLCAPGLSCAVACPVGARVLACVAVWPGLSSLPNRDL